MTAEFDCGDVVRFGEEDLEVCDAGGCVSGDAGSAEFGRVEVVLGVEDQAVGDPLGWFGLGVDEEVLIGEFAGGGVEVAVDAGLERVGDVPACSGTVSIPAPRRSARIPHSRRLPIAREANPIRQPQPLQHNLRLFALTTLEPQQNRLPRLPLNRQTPLDLCPRHEPTLWIHLPIIEHHLCRSGGCGGVRVVWDGRARGW